MMSAQEVYLGAIELIRMSAPLLLVSMAIYYADAIIDLVKKTVVGKVKSKEW